MPAQLRISAASTERFQSVLPRDSFEEFERAAEEAQELMRGRVGWNVNSTARGGGVVELLHPLVAYARGIGIDARWMVIDGNDEFFALTKRIHNRLHGVDGGGGPLGRSAADLYESVLQENLATFVPHVQPGDVVILHDPQTAGMVAALKTAGATVIWRCHVGLDHPDQTAREAWDFLKRYVEDADAYVFSRRSFAWEGLDSERIRVIPPSIDAFAPKNQHLAPDTVDAVLRASGLVREGLGEVPATFERLDGTPGRVDRRAKLFETQRLTLDVPVVMQVSRWDALKDPFGVIRGFAEHVPPHTGAHLLYAGPAVEAVADDPEGEQVLHDAIALLEELPEEARDRVHLATLPMVDMEENAIIVNALQRHARVVVQKSLAEGFGLTVAEAMWKARPVVASRIGGIQDQIEDGKSGVLLDDPRDLGAYGRAVGALLDEPRRAEQIGENAREQVRSKFLSARSLLDYLDTVRDLLARAA